MSSLRTLLLSLRTAGIAAATLLLALPALAGDIYSWRTEDGAYAFTDDPKAIPARYRDQVVKRETQGLSGYHRLTAPGPGSSDEYSQRLANRLEHLRALNQGLDNAYARRPSAGVRTLEINTGELNVGVPVDGGNEGPVVTENIRFRHKGELATRHNFVVSKGGEILAIIKGKRNIGEINQAPGITEMIE